MEQTWYWGRRDAMLHRPLAQPLPLPLPLPFCCLCPRNSAPKLTLNVADVVSQTVQFKSNKQPDSCRHNTTHSHSHPKGPKHTHTHRTGQKLQTPASVRYRYICSYVSMCARSAPRGTSKSDEMGLGLSILTVLTLRS